VLSKTTCKEAAIPSVYFTNARIERRCYTDLFCKETKVWATFVRGREDLKFVYLYYVGRGMRFGARF